MNERILNVNGDTVATAVFIKNALPTPSPSVATSSPVPTPTPSKTAKPKFYSISVQDNTPQQGASSITYFDVVSGETRVVEQATLPAGTVFTVTSLPFLESTFVRLDSSDPNELPVYVGTSTHTANMSKTYTANYAQIAPGIFTVSVFDDGDAVNGPYGDSVMNRLRGAERNAKYLGVPNRSEIEVVSRPNSGYYFVHLELNGKVVSTSPTSIHTITGNTKFTARYGRDVVVPQPSPSATPQPTPQASLRPSPPAPSPTPTIVWRSCVDDSITPGLPPNGWRELFRSGLGGGTCWEPVTVVGFTPDLNTALLFRYQRGSATLPQPVKIVATNPSYAISYRVALTTNEGVLITPSAFTLPARGSQEFIVNVTPELMDKLADGTSVFNLDIKMTQIL